MLSGQTRRTSLGYIAFAQQDSTDSWSMAEDGYGSEFLPHLTIRPVICTPTDIFYSNSSPGNLESRQGRNAEHTRHRRQP
jgi:hypothetical protein